MRKATLLGENTRNKLNELIKSEQVGGVGAAFIRTGRHFHASRIRQNAADRFCMVDETVAVVKMDLLVALAASQ